MGSPQEDEIYRYAPGFIAFSEGPEHRFTFANTAYEKLVGRTDLVGKKVVDVLPELSEQGFISLLDQVFQTGERTVGTNAQIYFGSNVKGERETRYIDFIYEAVRDANGTIVGLFCQGSDRTEAQVAFSKLEVVEAQLMHVSRMNAMGTMAATLAHEINQPLAAIANYASGCINVLDHENIASERLREGLTAIAAASDRAGKVIRRLRDMTKRTKPQDEIFDFSLALEEAAQLVRSGGCDSAAISTQCTPSLLVRGDRIQIQQVIINLLRNACDAASGSERVGTVTAMTQCSHGQVRLVVRDNGKGFIASKVSDIFQWSESSKADGMGIGLMICRTIAESHEGTIAVRETGPTGTTVVFSLPAQRMAVA